MLPANSPYGFGRRSERRPPREEETAGDSRGMEGPGYARLRVRTTRLIRASGRRAAHFMRQWSGAVHGVPRGKSRNAVRLRTSRYSAVSGCVQPTVHGLLAVVKWMIAASLNRSAVATG